MNLLRVLNSTSHLPALGLCVLLAVGCGAKETAPPSSTPSTTASTTSVGQKDPFEAPLAQITLTVEGVQYTFNGACNARAPSETAKGGARLSPNRPPWTWIQGCDGSTASFYAGITRTPTEGTSPVTIFNLQLPGAKMQDLGSARADVKSNNSPQPKLATFHFTHVTDTRMSGTFELELRTQEGGTFKQAHGTFDVPRSPDDTSRGP